MKDEEISMNEFPEKLRRLRKEKEHGKNVDIVSQLIGLSPNMLREYEKGKCEPTLSKLKLIAEYYNVSLSYFDDTSNKE